MALWIARDVDKSTIHGKKPKWVVVECALVDCTSCSGFEDDILELCAVEARKHISGLKKLKDREVVKLTVKIGG